MKIILILLDGLGDRAYPELSHRTPLQAAKTPNLDQLAALGSNGLFHASYPGQCLPSEIAHYLLFGYDLKDFPGRGLLEAIGEDVSFEDEDVLCLAHLCKIEWREGVAILTRGRDEITGTREEFGRVYSLINCFEADTIRVRLEHTRRNDAILVFRGPVSDRISDSDPMRTGNPIASVEPLAGASSEHAERTATFLNAYLRHCHEILNDPVKNPYQRTLPVNFLATQRSGKYRPQNTFYDRWGLRGAMIASPSVYAGLARVIGLDFIPAMDTASPGKDLSERIAQAITDTDHDFVHVHTKVADEAAHTGDPQHKREMISRLDSGLDEICSAIQGRDDILLAITADHSTPCGSPLIHSGEAVPLLICGPNVRRDNVNIFDEIEASHGCLGMLRGHELLAMLLNYANRSALYSHRLGGEDRPYVSLNYHPFER